MATNAIRTARLPQVALAQAWGRTIPPLKGTSQVVAPAAPVTKLLPTQLPATDEADAQQPMLPHSSSAEKTKSFKMHVGANISIPTKNARDLPRPQPTPSAAQQQQQQQGVVDPFEGLPFRNFAERLGAAVLPAVEAAREAERQAKLSARHAVAEPEAEAFIPPVPHMLPLTRWAASSTEFRSTFIAESPKERKRVRLSWYHPDDTMVPRDWFRGGLLADIKYWNPFGLFK